MNTIERIFQVALQGLLAILLSIVCVRLVTGCTVVKTVRDEARPAVVLALKEAYACGGAEAVSNRIERLVADGRITPAQAQGLHTLAQNVYDGVIERLEAEILADAVAEQGTNSVPANVEE